MEKYLKKIQNSKANLINATFLMIKIKNLMNQFKKVYRVFKEYKNVLQILKIYQKKFIQVFHVIYALEKIHFSQNYKITS